MVHEIYKICLILENSKSSKFKALMIKVEIQGDVEDLAGAQVCMTLVKLCSHLIQFLNFENGNKNPFSSYFIGFEDQVR